MRWPRWLCWPPWRDVDDGGRAEQVDAAVSTAAEALEDAKIKARQAAAKAAQAVETASRSLTLAQQVHRLTAEVDQALRMRGTA